MGSLVLAKAPGAALRDARPTQAYGSAVEWAKDDKTLATVQWGGVNHDHPHVVVPGSGGLSGFVRQELGTSGYGFDTKASRVDVAMDFRHVPFGVLSALCGTPSRVVTNTNAAQGDTHYFGSRQSRHFVRVYEKGKQMGLPQLSDWVRVEVEVKPDKAAGKRAAMTASHSELIRSGRVGRKVADAYGVVGDPLRMGGARAGARHDLVRRVKNMRRQYGSTIDELMQACGDDLDLFLDCLRYGISEDTMMELSDRG
jgi:DNA relaxase NicK